MISKFGGQCFTCYRAIAAGTEVGYKRGRGIRCLGGCAPISTEDLAAGRARFEDVAARRAARRTEPENPYARHDAANEVVYADRVAVAAGAPG